MIDEGTASEYASIYDSLRRRGEMIPINDVWIAASAAQHDLRVLTMDRHFGRIDRIRCSIYGT